MATELLGLGGDPRALRRMKVTATSLLLLAAVVFAVSHRVDGTLARYVEAGAEAAMVGGLADWFAVTALFRRPLGLPIPHTALVPRKKDELAMKLGEFVTGHFLTREVVEAQVTESRAVERVGAWLAQPEVAARLARELAFNAGAVLDVLDPDEVTGYVLDLLRHDQSRRSYAPVLGRVLERAVEGGTTRPLVDVCVTRSRAYLRAHRDELMPQARSFVDDRGWLAALLVSDRRIRKTMDAVAALLDEVARDPAHPLRGWLEGLFRSVAQQLQQDGQTAARFDVVVSQLIEDPQAQAALRDLVVDALATLRASLVDPDSPLQDRVAGLVSSLGSRVGSDPAFRDRLLSVVQRVLGHAVENYGDELTSLIRGQVARWDATSASRRIELAVGRDLQFIRINGTAVGALAGLGLHGVSQLLG
ncbi:MAG TPA: DUF445 domain-containing protein [Mycobacteriales bacterium]|nr:DUF445 domain-containing protein [Mycobacteriales bacterium]